MNKTKIRWTDYTSNPIYAIDANTMKRGWICTRVSPGCGNCYAATLNRRIGTGHDFTPENWDKVTLFFNDNEIAEWRKEKYNDSKVFVCDMTDLFHEKMPIVYQTAAFIGMFNAPKLTFQLLTKRPAQMAHVVEMMMANATDTGVDPLPKNIWVGTSVEDKLRKPRINVLRKIDAPVRFLSVEPLLEDVGELDLDGISWVIVGGESGQKFRSMDPQWALNVRDQCRSQKVAFFYKQGSGIRTEMDPYLEGKLYEEFP